jgi:hypothetical protein
VSPEAVGREKEAAAGEDLFQFGQQAGAAAAPPPVAAAGALLPMGLVDDTLAGDAEPDEAAEELFDGPRRRAALPPVVVPLLVVMAIANLALVGLTWKALRREAPPSAPAGHAADEGHGHPSSPEGEAEGGEQHADEMPRLAHLAGTRDEAWAALDDAERTLDAGEFVAARRELYGLLTVLDRVELSERPDVEARAGFLIAESYRLQARSTAAAAEEAP